MKTWIAAAIMGVALTAGDPVAAAPAAATPATPAVQTAEAKRATDFSARRHHLRNDRHGYRPQPRYYARPYYYRPYPYAVPAPFTFGFAFGPAW